MELRITWKYIIAFIALNFIMGELHEQAHISTGYFICGCYGPRDFNVWQTCGQCAHPTWAFLATLAGPLFSCSLMWLGVYWFSRSESDAKRMTGFSLLFANLPFARIFTALTGGGDEKIVIQSLLGDTGNSLTSKMLAALVVLLVCLPPILIAGKKIRNKRHWGIVAGFAITPLIYGMLYQHLFLNWLLMKKEVLPETHFLGSPDLVLLHFVLMAVLLGLFRKGLLELKNAG